MGFDKEQKFFKMQSLAAGNELECNEAFKISEDAKKSIAKGIKQAENGELKPHSEVRKLYEKWL